MGLRSVFPVSQSVRSATEKKTGPPSWAPICSSNRRSSPSPMWTSIPAFFFTTRPPVSTTPIPVRRFSSAKSSLSSGASTNRNASPWTHKPRMVSCSPCLTRPAKPGPFSHGGSVVGASPVPASLVPPRTRAKVSRGLILRFWT